MSHALSSSRKGPAIPLRGLHTVPEQENDGEASAPSQGSAASRRKKENSSPAATSATRSSSRPSADRRPTMSRQQYDPQRERRRIREEEAIRQRQLIRDEQEARRRASRASPSRYAKARRRPDDPRYYAVQKDRRQLRRYADHEEYDYYEEPRRQSSIGRGYPEPARRPRPSARSRASVAPPVSRSMAPSRAVSGYGEARRRTRNNSYYFDEFDDDYESFASLDYYFEEEEPPLEERVYVDAAGRPYRVLAPVEPRRRVYRPGRDDLTTPVPPPLRSAFDRPSNSRMPRRRDYYPEDRYRRQQRASRLPRRAYPGELEEWDEEEEGSRRVSRYSRPRERPSGLVAVRSKPSPQDDNLQASTDDRDSRARRSKAEFFDSVAEGDEEGDSLVAEDDELEAENDYLEPEDVQPRDPRGRLQRRHSIGSAHSREHLLEDIHAAQVEDERIHRGNTPPRRTVQGRLLSSSHFLEWSPPPSSTRHRSTRESSRYQDSYGQEEPGRRGQLRRTSSNPSLDSASHYVDEEQAHPPVRMRPVRVARPFRDKEYEEDDYAVRGRHPRRHSFGSMSEYTMDRSYMEDSYPSIF